MSASGRWTVGKQVFADALFVLSVPHSSPRDQCVRKTLPHRWAVGNGTLDHFRHRPRCSTVILELGVLFFPNSVVVPSRAALFMRQVYSFTQMNQQINE